MRESIGPWTDFTGVTTPGRDAVVPIPATLLSDEDHDDRSGDRQRPAAVPAGRQTCGCATLRF
ncbi:hypothetical protein HKK72_08470 [Actinomadura sp. HBU206391]|nr:hypothetical protein [Actinomadura sp. HBU206391]